MRDKRRIVKGWRGRLVRLNRRITTKGGDVWDAGEVMRVTGTWRSGVHLEPVDRDPLEDNRGRLHHVPRSEVTLLAPVPHPALLRALEEWAGADVLALEPDEAEPFLACGLLEQMNGEMFDTQSCLDLAEKLGCPSGMRIRHVFSWLEEHGHMPEGAPAYRISPDGREALLRERQRLIDGESWKPPRAMPESTLRPLDDPEEIAELRKLVASGKQIDIAAERKRRDLFAAYVRTGCTTKRRVATLTNPGLRALMDEIEWCLAWHIPDRPLVFGRKAWEHLQ